MKIAMPRDFRKRLHSVVRKAGRCEIGGVLMAEQIEPGNFRLVEFSVDRLTGDTAHFVRSVEDHQAALSAFFGRTGADYERFNYLGEWHSHPNHLPIASREDAQSMEGLVNEERNIPFAVLLIVRVGWGKFSCSATLFERGAESTSVSIRVE
jgi:[CysO sulfur-carrier protein]-S-L-cysteine hydrolase